MFNSDSVEDEIRRCRELLRTSIRVAGLSVAEVERRLGIRPRTLQRVLLGRFDLKLRHILAVLEVLGLKYEDFYRAAAERRQGTLAAGILGQVGNVGLRGARPQALPGSEDGETAFQVLVAATVQKTLERIGWEEGRDGRAKARLDAEPQPRSRQAPPPRKK
jgi:transcriptional regulator with XRE-family HTH domain